MTLGRRRNAKIRRSSDRVGQGASAERLFLGDRLFVAAQPRAVGLLGRRAASGGNRPKLMFIGWNERGPASMVSMWPPVMWPSSEPSAVVGGGGASARRAHRPPHRGPRSGRCGGFDVTLAAGDLAGKSQPRLRRGAMVVEQFGEFRKVLRCRPPSRANSAFSRPG